jgi:nitrite reductase/ring-hydroxylating ferredoxin subunit
MSDPIKIAETSDLQPGEGKIIRVNGRELALFNVDGTFHCIDNVCPHQGGPLGDGHLEGTTVSCPLHGWKFDVTTGKCSLIPSAEVDSFECTVDGNDVQVTL